MSFAIRGEAEKMFKEILPQEDIFYINPTNQEIIALRIKDIKPYPMKKGWVILTYYQTVNAMEMGFDEVSIPTKDIICEGSAKRFISMSHPPSVYFTNKRALERFMGKR